MRTARNASKHARTAVIVRKCVKRGNAAVKDEANGGRNAISSVVSSVRQIGEANAAPTDGLSVVSNVKQSAGQNDAPRGVVKNAAHAN